MTDPDPRGGALDRHGLIAAFTAYTVWGLLPVYIILVRSVPAVEILLHRILWAVPFALLAITVRRQWPELRAGLLTRRTLLPLCASACFMAFNWFVYIVGVQNGGIFETSLGYYINPLLYVVVGVVAFGERLTRNQTVAVILAAAGVLTLTIYGGRVPWIALLLASSFTAYGVLRKQIAIAALPGLTIETILMVPFACVGLALFASGQETAFLNQGPAITALLVLGGPLTVVPFVAFAMAARRLPLSVLGFTQFLGPTLQFLIGVLDGEAFTPAHQICFALIWSAAILFAWDAWRGRRRRPVPA